MNLNTFKVPSEMCTEDLLCRTVKFRIWPSKARNGLVYTTFAVCMGGERVWSVALQTQMWKHLNFRYYKGRYQKKHCFGIGTEAQVLHWCQYQTLVTIPCSGKTGSWASLLACSPQIQSGFQSLWLPSTEDSSWSKQGSWDIEFLPICLNIAVDSSLSELQLESVEDSLRFLQTTRAREWLAWAFLSPRS